MSSVGIMAWMSALEDGAPMKVPDFKNEAERKQYENDNRSPFPSHAETGNRSLPASITGTVKPTKAGMTAARRIWKSAGYTGK
jgi:hypothetical protein